MAVEDVKFLYPPLHGRSRTSENPVTDAGQTSLACPDGFIVDLESGEPPKRLKIPWVRAGVLDLLANPLHASRQERTVAASRFTYANGFRIAGQQVVKHERNYMGRRVDDAGLLRTPRDLRASKGLGLAFGQREQAGLSPVGGTGCLAYEHAPLRRGQPSPMARPTGTESARRAVPCAPGARAGGIFGSGQLWSVQGVTAHRRFRGWAVDG